MFQTLYSHYFWGFVVCVPYCFIKKQSSLQEHTKHSHVYGLTSMCLLLYSNKGFTSRGSRVCSTFREAYVILQLTLKSPWNEKSCCLFKLFAIFFTTYNHMQQQVMKYVCICMFYALKSKKLSFISAFPVKLQWACALIRLWK